MPGNWSPPDSPQGPGGVNFPAMPAEPDIKRADSFIDGQNLYRHAKDAFGHHHPNFDPRRLAGRRRYVNVPKGNGGKRSFKPWTGPTLGS